MSSNNTNPRKTFAIISHPDAGKTTLTEKLLLFGGAIQQAGAVKARGENRHFGRFFGDDVRLQGHHLQPA